MAIGNYLKEIGRGKDGARALSRQQSSDLMAQILDGEISDIEIGAFCIAMRVKGETPDEMAGFLDAIQARAVMIQPSPGPFPTIVIPSYNGARKLPGLTPLLALLLAREGLGVVVHGTPTEDKRIHASETFALLGVDISGERREIREGEVRFFPTRTLCGGLHQLLEVRRVIQLRNPAHSLVKLMSPVDGPSIVVSSYTHPEYAVSMAQTVNLLGLNCMLLRGTEGESVADPRRTPKMDLYKQGTLLSTHPAQSGSLISDFELPTDFSPQKTTDFIHRILNDSLPVPPSIALQVRAIQVLAEALSAPL